jgi:hypothetical protein
MTLTDLPAEGPRPMFLLPSEAAALTGPSPRAIAPSSAASWRPSGFCSRLRIPREAFERWIENLRVEPGEPAPPRLPVPPPPPPQPRPAGSFRHLLAPWEAVAVLCSTPLGPM